MMPDIYKQICRVVLGDSNATAHRVQREEGTAADVAGGDCDKAGMPARAREAVRLSQQRARGDSSERTREGRSEDAARRAAPRWWNGGEWAMRDGRRGAPEERCPVRAADGRRRAQPKTAVQHDSIGIAVAQ